MADLYRGVKVKKQLLFQKFSETQQKQNNYHYYNYKNYTYRIKNNFTKNICKHSKVI